MQVAVIVVSYNSGPLLVESVQAALASSVGVEVIVSDNGSTDCSLSALEDLAQSEPRLKVVRNGSNLGFAAANNRVLPLVRSPYVLFLNPDCVVGPDTLARVAAALGGRPQAGMAGCLIRNPDGTEQEGCRRRLPTPVGLLAKALGLHRFAARNPALADFVQRGEPLPSAATQVEAISGAFMMVRREALERVGPFDAGYFMHWEDLDLCARFGAAGYDILFVPDAEVLHFKGRSSRRRPLRVEWHKHAGMARYLRKFHFRAWPTPGLALLMLPIGLRFALQVLRSVLPGRRGPADAARPVLPDRPEAWVFGATSAVGGCLLPRLLAAGFAVRAFSRRGQDEGGRHLAWERVDIAAGGAAAPARGRPDVVIHLAPLDLLPAHLEQLLQAGTRRLIAFGSTSVFTKRDGSPAERRLMDRFEAAEQAVEARCHAANVRWSVFRPTIIYGPGMASGIGTVARFVRRFGFFPVLGSAGGLRQPVHADDLAKACLQLLASDRGWDHAYNLSGGEVLGYRDMLVRIFRAQARPPRIVRVPRSWLAVAVAFARLLPAYRGLNMAMAGRADRDMNFDHDEARRAFGYAPRAFQP